MKAIDILYKKYKDPIKMIHFLTSGKSNYSKSMISHMITNILNKYPIQRVSKTYKYSAPINILAVPPNMPAPVPPSNEKSTTRKVKKGKSFFSKLFT